MKINAVELTLVFLFLATGILKDWEFPYFQSLLSILHFNYYCDKIYHLFAPNRSNSSYCCVNLF